MPIHIVYELDTLACKARGNFGRNHNLIIGLPFYTVLIVITDSVKPQRARFGTIPSDHSVVIHNSHWQKDLMPMGDFRPSERVRAWSLWFAVVVIIDTTDTRPTVPFRIGVAGIGRPLVFRQCECLASGHQRYKLR